MTDVHDRYGGPATNGGVVPQHLVQEVSTRVGEILSERHAADAESHRPRMPIEDERALTRKLIADELARLATDAFASGRQPLSEAEEATLAAAVFDRVHGMGRLQPLLDDPNIRDIHISGHKKVFLILRDGSKIPGPPIADSEAELMELISTAARRLGRSERRWDQAHPSLNMRLPNGDRLHALMAVSGHPVVEIRRHDFSIARMDDLVDRGLMEPAVSGFLSAAVRARLNIIVSGDIGTGKTTMLRCLINEIPANERLITIEDNLELGLGHFEDLHPDQETLEARDGNIEGVGAFTLADLVREGLRMNPQRVIVGEVRGEEVLSMLLAMTQGNAGSMCSIHAKSSKGVFGRLVMYAAMTREGLAPEVTNLLVGQAIDLIVHLQWIDGVRRVVSIREVTATIESGQIASNEIWALAPDGSVVPQVPPSQDTVAALAEVGYDATWRGGVR